MREAVPWERVEWLIDSYPEKKGYVRISTDILDFFIDTAKATDSYEMIGYLLGRFKKVGDKELIQLYDYIQCRNIADDPTREAFPAPECDDEVDHLFDIGRYDINTVMHTHPSDSLFSVDDLYVLYECCKNDHIREWFAPHFLVTGGEIGYILAYTNVPFVIQFISDAKELFVSSRPFNEAYTYPKYVKRAKSAAYADEFIEFLSSIEWVRIMISSLEPIKPEPQLNYGSSLHKSTKEGILRVKKLRIHRRRILPDIIQKYKRGKY
ncbi:hypothetical protein CW714_09070 [Methanophagales archaeon]|nr:MAG: hypothetical protein CW714_09070 [Methanophagales archaeon]